jgi:hypothetical protein
MPDFVKNPVTRSATLADPDAGFDDSGDVYEDA